MKPLDLLLYLSAASVALAVTVGCGEGGAPRPSSATVPTDASSTAGHAGEEGHDEHEAGEHPEDEEQHAEEGHADEVRLTAEAIERYGIVVGQAERRQLAGIVTAPARVGFNREAMAHIGSLVEGRISEIRASLGDRVDAGDVLLVVDSPELGQLQGDYLAKQSAVAAAKPAVEIARGAYQRAQDLYDQTEGGISLTEVQRRQAELRAAERELAMAEAGLTAAANGLRLHGMSDEEIATLAETAKVNPLYEVRAPIAGEVVEREVTPGELVSPDDESLMVLGDLSRLWVLVDVAEAKLVSVGVGSMVTLEVPAMPDRTFEGEVTYVSPLVNEATRTARLRVEVDNADRLLRPGMFARASVGAADGGGEGVTAVPAVAVMTVENEPSVFVPVEEPNTFARRAVVVGERVGGHIPILSGLEPGEPVVTAGTFILKAELGKAGVEHAH